MPRLARPKRHKPAKQREIRQAKPSSENNKPVLQPMRKRRYAKNGVPAPYACVPASDCPGLAAGHLWPSASCTGPDPVADPAPLCHRCLEWANLFGQHDKERRASSRWPARWSALGQRISAARGWARALKSGARVTELAAEAGVSKARLHQILNLLGLPEVILAAVGGIVPASAIPTEVELTSCLKRCR